MSRLREMDDSRGAYNTNKCSFCANETNGIGGFWAGHIDICVCVDCKYKLIHLFFDTCADDKGFITRMREFSVCNPGIVFSEDDMIAISEYIEATPFVSDIAKHKAKIEKELRYKQYLKLKNEFEG